MMSNHHASYALGYKRATMAITKRSEIAIWSKTQKVVLNSDCGLKPAHMKSELLVIPNQHVCSPRRKRHDDLTSSPPSSVLSTAVPIESPSYCWQLLAGVALVAGLNPTSHDTS